MAMVEQIGDNHWESYESTWQNPRTPGLKSVREYQNGMINVDKLCFIEIYNADAYKLTVQIHTRTPVMEHVDSNVLTFHYGKLLKVR